MLNLLLYGMIALFVLIYLLRSILMAGYERLNAKNEKGQHSDSLSQLLLNTIITLKPLREAKLRARSIDQKRHLVFQQKATVYYYLLWLTLFAILFLAAKIYLDAF